MIPPFRESGVLPPGIHTATLAEVEVRFGRGSAMWPIRTGAIRSMAA